MADTSDKQPGAVQGEGKDLARSARARASLAEARARGVQLGKAGAQNLRATVEKRKSAADAFAQQHAALFAEFQAQGLTHRQMAEALNERGVAAARGGAWTHGQVQRMLNRYAAWQAGTGTPEGNAAPQD